jgi:mevalonate kinase
MLMPVVCSPAKWILCGEHSVIRGGKAIVFPLRNFSNILSFERSDNFFIEDSCSKDTVLTLFEKACRILDVAFEKIFGHIVVKSDIPVCSGLGSSAALCVNVAKIFKYFGYCSDTFELARCLENEFHLKSSGSDIAAVLENKPIVFRENRVTEFLKPCFCPHMLLTYSGEKSATADCITVVRDFFLKDKKKAIESDMQMNLASDMCENAFKEADFNKLKDGIMLGNDVFLRWGLYTEAMLFHVKNLLSDGAVAAKPVGSGLGGYIVSLWEEFPKKIKTEDPLQRIKIQID